MKFFLVVVLLTLGSCVVAWVLSSRQPAPPPNLSDDHIREEARRNRHNAMRWYRILHGSGLREAKEKVEQFLKEENQ